jgi:hypothetical protein
MRVDYKKLLAGIKQSKNLNVDLQIKHSSQVLDGLDNLAQLQRKHEQYINKYGEVINMYIGGDDPIAVAASFQEAFDGLTNDLNKEKANFTKRKAEIADILPGLHKDMPSTEKSFDFMVEPQGDVHESRGSTKQYDSRKRAESLPKQVKALFRTAGQHTKSIEESSVNFDSSVREEATAPESDRTINSKNNLVTMLDEFIENFSQGKLGKNQLLNMQAYLKYVFGLKDNLNTEELITKLESLKTQISSVPSNVNEVFSNNLKEMNSRLDGFSSYLVANLREFLNLLSEKANSKIFSAEEQNKFDALATFIEEVFGITLSKKASEVDSVYNQIAELIGRCQAFRGNGLADAIFIHTSIVPLLSQDAKDIILVSDYIKHQEMHNELANVLTLRETQATSYWTYLSNKKTSESNTSLIDQANNIKTKYKELHDYIIQKKAKIPLIECAKKKFNFSKQDIYSKLEFKLLLNNVRRSQNIISDTVADLDRSFKELLTQPANDEELA